MIIRIKLNNISIAHPHNACGCLEHIVLGKHNHISLLAHLSEAPGAVERSVDEDHRSGLRYTE